jgi:zinc transport system substrate-binding protein
MKQTWFKEILLMKKVVIYILCAAMLIALFGCAQVNTSADGGENGLSIVTTIFPPYDFARAIADGKADVTMLIDPGTEVHTFDPTPEDIIKIQNADVFIYIGGENDAWVDQVLESMDVSGKTILRLIDAVTPVEEETVEGMQSDHDHAHEEEAHAHEEEAREHEEEHHHGYDEHIWTSPKNAISMINYIADALGRIDEDNAESYTQNAADYTAQIAKVDEQIQSIVDASQTKLLVVADRFPFRYLADEFGLDYRAAFSGCTSESEASARTLAYLIDTVKEKDINFVYYIEFSNQAVAKAVSEQTGAEMLLLHSCHNVTREDFKAGVTYLKLMQDNAENLEKGLK